MPALSFWFSGLTLFAAASFIFMAAVSLIGIKSFLTKHIFTGLLIAALALSLAGWWAAASQEEKAAQQSDQNRYLQKTLDNIAKALNVNPDQNADAIARAVLRRLPSSDWHLAADQKRRLVLELKSIVPAFRPIVNLQALIGSSQSQMYKDDLATAFHDSGWQVTGGVDMGIRPDLKGLFIAVSPKVKRVDQIPSNAQIVVDVFSRAGIAYAIGERDGLAGNQVHLDIGAKPD